MSTIKQLLRPYHIIYASIRRFFIEKYPSKVSALTFSLLLAIVPYLLVSVFFFTHFPTLMDMVRLGQQYILEHFIPSSAHTIEKYFHGFILQASGLPTINILFLIFSVTMMVSTIEETLNSVWLVPNRSNFSLVFILNWFFILLLPFIIGLSVFVSSYFSAFVTRATQFYGLSAILLACTPFLVNTLIFTLVYVLIPNVNVTWREGFSCGILAALLFEIARMLFEFYITRLTDYTLIYGIFAIIPIFLLWLYIFWMIIVFSALLVQEVKYLNALENSS